MQERVQQAISATAYSASGGTVAAGWLTLNEWALITGIAGTILTIAINIVYKHLHYKLEKAKTDDN